MAGGAQGQPREPRSRVEAQQDDASARADEMLRAAHRGEALQGFRRADPQ